MDNGTKLYFLVLIAFLAAVILGLYGCAREPEPETPIIYDSPSSTVIDGSGAEYRVETTGGVVTSIEPV